MKKVGNVVIEKRFRSDDRNPQEVLWTGCVWRDLHGAGEDMVGVAELVVSGDNELVLRYEMRKAFPFDERDEVPLADWARGMAGDILAARYQADVEASHRLDTNPLPAIRSRHPWRVWKWADNKLVAGPAAKAARVWLALAE